MKTASAISRSMTPFFLALFLIALCSIFISYSQQAPYETMHVSIDYLAKAGPATRIVNGTEYALDPQQAQWAQKLYLEKNVDAVAKSIQELLSQNSERASLELFLRYAILSTIPDDRYVGLMKSVLDEWCRKSPDSHIPWLVRGAFYIDLAWNIRGGGYASEITDASMKGFQDNLEWAQKDLERSYRLKPKDPNSSCLLMRVDLGLGHEFREMQRHFLDATRAYPGHYGAHRYKYVFLLPQWNGSVEEMNAFADECLEQSAKYPNLGLIKVAAYADMRQRRNIEGYAGHVERFINGGDVWPTIDSIYKRIFEQFPDDLLAHFSYARNAMIFNREDIAVNQFRIIGNRWMMLSLWTSLENYDGARTQAYRAAAGGSRDDRAGEGSGPKENPSNNSATKSSTLSDQSAYPDPQAKYRHADQLAREGKQKEALAEYLWCFDEGMRKAPEFAGVRLSFLLGSISRLGKQYPPALHELRNRRDAAKSSLAANPENISAQADFVALNRELGESEANLVFYDQLPLRGPSRASFGPRIFDTFIEARRYRDALEVRPFETFMKGLLTDIEMARKSSALPMHRIIVDKGSKELEALVGTENFDEARVLLKIIRQLDSSEDTLRTLRMRLERAGHEELLQETDSKEQPKAPEADHT